MLSSLPWLSVVSEGMAAVAMVILMMVSLAMMIVGEWMSPALESSLLVSGRVHLKDPLRSFVYLS